MHELGHNLGLWHVHQGMECVDDCREHRASGVLGDLVADTNPTPENAFCRLVIVQDEISNQIDLDT